MVSFKSLILFLHCSNSLSCSKYYSDFGKHGLLPEATRIMSIFESAQIKYTSLYFGRVFWGKGHPVHFFLSSSTFNFLSLSSKRQYYLLHCSFYKDLLSTFYQIVVHLNSFVWRTECGNPTKKYIQIISTGNWHDFVIVPPGKYNQGSLQKAYLVYCCFICVLKKVWTAGLWSGYKLCHWSQTA